MLTAIVHRIAWIPLRLLFRLFANFEVFGLEHIRGVPPPAVFQANHHGPFDPFLVGIALPWGSKFHGIRWLTRDDEFKRPIRRHTLRLFGAFPGKVRKSWGKALEQPKEFIRQGRSVGIFPEWCYANDPYALERSRWILPLLSSDTGRSVIPVFLFGVERVTWWRLFRRKLHIHVAFGQPYELSKHSERRHIFKKAEQYLSRVRLDHLNRRIHEGERRFWEEYGSFYRYLERADAYQELIHDFGEMLPEHISGRWVDLGSGSGTVIELLLHRARGDAAITASDHNETMLAELRRRFPTGVTIAHVDLVARLPFPDASLDGVTANLVLPYVVHHEGAFGNLALERLLRDIRRILKPGGTLIWSAPKENVKFIAVFIASLPSILRGDQRENLLFGPKILRQALRIQTKGRRGIYHFLERKELIALSERIGFRELRIDRSMAGQVYILRATK